MCSSLQFQKMPAATNESATGMGFEPVLAGTGAAYGCIVDPERRLAYSALLYTIPAAAGLAGGVFRLPNSFIVPIVGGCAAAH